MLPSGDLTWMRSQQNRTMTDSVKVYRGGDADDGMGGHTSEPVQVGTLACRIAASGNSPAERLIAQQVNAVSTYTLTFPAGADVRSGDTLKETAGEERTLSVIAPLHGTNETARRVVCTMLLGDEAGEV